MLGNISIRQRLRPTISEEHGKSGSQHGQSLMHARNEERVAGDKTMPSTVYRAAEPRTGKYKSAPPRRRYRGMYIKLVARNACSTVAVDSWVHGFMLGHGLMLTISLETRITADDLIHRSSADNYHGRRDDCEASSPKIDIERRTAEVLLMTWHLRENNPFELQGQTFVH